MSERRLMLSPEDRERLRVSLEKLKACRMRWLRFRRTTKAKEGDWDERMALEMPCGLRVCPYCGEEARKNAGSRLMPGQFHSPARVRWRTFLTLTFPRDGHDPAGWWRRAGYYIGRFWQKMKRAIWKWYGIRCKDRKKHPWTYYGWVIEPTPSNPEWPHVHMAFSMPWFGDLSSKAMWQWSEFAKRTWNECIGATSLWRHWSEVKDPQRAAKYLVKYLTKSGWEDETLALMYRRRQWGTNLPAPPSEPAGWQSLGYMSADDVAAWWGGIREAERLGAGEVMLDTRSMVQVRYWVETPWGYWDAESRWWPNLERTLDNIPPPVLFVA